MEYFLTKFCLVRGKFCAGIGKMYIITNRSEIKHKYHFTHAPTSVNTVDELEEWYLELENLKVAKKQDMDIVIGDMPDLFLV